MHPRPMSAPSCIVPPTEQLMIRPHIVPLLPIFHGMESENPYVHIKEFEEVCNTFQEGGASIDLMRLKLFPFTLKDKAKEQISNFSAKENEKFYECWERYMEAINACPHHSFDTWLLVSYFYDVSRGWDEPNAREVGRMKSQPNAPNAKAGMYTLNEDIDMKAKVAAMARRLEELEMKKITIVNLSKVVGDFVGDHKSINAQLSQRIDNVESTLNKMMDGMQNDLSQKIDNLQYSISRLTNLNTVQEKGKFPSQPHKNPNGIHEVEAQEGESSQVRENLHRTEEDHQPGRNDEETHASTFPPSFAWKKGINNASEILEVLRQVKVNIPFLDMIKQVLTYAKFLKDLCTIKRGLNVNKKVFFTEQVSAIIQCKSLVKYKDPGCPTISVMIGGTCVEKALLELGTSVNLLPYSVYKQLGLGELKPTSITYL
ncbi:hypothetical protein CK203_113860 [Vitis vinifera]|uniref:Retrotransposon gag domain-containing protein n=1 Tax=Vitis vinifera TaxID=29760 RepID=A0A438FD53_VITVI|nr:hypothetical protein CK203_113860 [Vitis vinifera]